MTSQTGAQHRPRALSAAQIEALWSPQDDETVLWQGRPDALAMARTAFHAPLVAGYFALLATGALAFGGGMNGALVTLGAGAIALGILHALAYVAARTTRYILTDHRVILHIGMAIEKTVNLPLRQIEAAHLSDKGRGFGDIALQPAGTHTLGYLLLWPHARPWRFANPQPMLRALPDAAAVAERLASAVAAHQPIERRESAAIAKPAPAIEGALA